MTNLCEFDKDEWWDVARAAKPDITREEYEAMWEEAMQEKAKKRLQ